jgi:hypothetical protein
MMVLYRSLLCYENVDNSSEMAYDSPV